MKKCSLLIMTIFLAFAFATAQEGLPDDYLTKEFHASRREALRKKMPDSSVAVIFAYPTRTFSNDVSYTYHPNPDLYYFSGYKEPNSVLFIFKNPQTIGNKKCREIFFAQKRDPRSEQWTGRRMGAEKVQSELDIDTALNGDAFHDFPLDLSGFTKILFAGLPEGMADDQSDPADLYDLVRDFETKARFPAGYDNNAEALAGQAVAYCTPSNMKAFIAYVKRMASSNPSLANNQSIKEFLECKDSVSLDAFKQKVRSGKFNSGLYTELVASLRQIKTAEEMELMRKSISISALAHAEVMKAVHPGMSEREIQGLQEYVHKRYGAENVGYPSIVGAGANGCVLHYEENAKMSIGNDMVLMDVGAEYHGYSADVTRTIPANGKFSKEQEAIYNLVYEAQEAVFKICKEGTPINQLNQVARKVLAEGLLKLGIIKNVSEVDTYYPHGCSHFLGLDVHDAGNYGGTLQENMVLTVEPGIYIPANSDCDKKWWGIAVRIEDDVRVGKEQFELLSYQAPRKARDIEKMIASKSVLEDYILPPLKQPKKGF